MKSSHSLASVAIIDDSFINFQTRQNLYTSLQRKGNLSFGQRNVLCHSRTLKKKLVEAPILIHPDFTKSFTLDVDASDISIGAVLSQNTEKGECVVAYARRTFTKTERRYCVTRKELLALVYFVKYFRHYLYGKKFRVRTDHSSLRWLMNFKNPEGQVVIWIEFYHHLIYRLNIGQVERTEMLME